MSLVRRIGTTSFLYGDCRARDRQRLEQDAVVRRIAEAGSLGIDLMLFQEEYSFWASGLEEAPGRASFVPARVDRLAAPADARPPAEPPAALAVTLRDPYVERVREACREAGVNVALPLLERDGDRIYNSLVPVTAAGDLMRPYRKMFPVPLGELSAGITPGSCNAAQVIAGVPVSFAICFDVHFDEVFTEARRSGARLVLWSSMWMGGSWLRAQALRCGLYVVSATPDGCTFVDIDGQPIVESPSLWPQVEGHNNIVFEDINFDRQAYHCFAAGTLNAIRAKYGAKVHIRNRPQDSIVVIESLDPGLSIGDIEREFGLRSWFQYIEESRAASRAARPRA